MTCQLVFFILVLLPPVLCAEWERTPPPPLQCVHFTNKRICSRLWRSCIFGTYTFRVRVQASRKLFAFPCYFWTRLPLRGYRCAQQMTDRSSLFSFLLEEFVRELLVRVLYLDRTVSVQFYLVGTSIVSVIASCPPP